MSTGTTEPTPTLPSKKIGILIPSTSRNRNWSSWKETYLYSLTLKSFLLTYDKEHTYTFYIGIDRGDLIYDDETVVHWIHVYGWHKARSFNRHVEPFIWSRMRWWMRLFFPVRRRHRICYNWVGQCMYQNIARTPGDRFDRSAKQQCAHFNTILCFEKTQRVVWILFSARHSELVLRRLDQWRVSRNSTFFPIVWTPM